MSCLGRGGADGTESHPQRLATCVALCRVVSAIVLECGSPSGLGSLDWIGLVGCVSIRGRRKEACVTTTLRLVRRGSVLHEDSLASIVVFPRAPWFQWCLILNTRGALQCE